MVVESDLRQRLHDRCVVSEVRRPAAVPVPIGGYPLLLRLAEANGLLLRIAMTYPPSSSIGSST